MEADRDQAGAVQGLEKLGVAGKGLGSRDKAGQR